MLLYGWLERAVKEKGGTKALIYRDTYLSWRGLMHRVKRRATEFKTAGVRSGDLVGLMLGNVPDFVILSLALSKLEAIPLPLDPTTSTRELEMLMSLAPLRAVITRPRGGDAPLPDAPTKPGGATKNPPESRKRLQGTLLSCSVYTTEQRKLPRKKEERIAVVLVTGDSAGDPKPVERTCANLQAEADQVCEALSLDGEDRVLLTVPLFQSFGFDVGMVSALAAGATIYLEDEIAPSRIIKLVREQKVTLLPGGRPLFNQLSRLPANRPLAHKPARMLSLNGGLKSSALDTFKDKYGVGTLACFHTTETSTVSIDSKGRAPSSVGKPLGTTEVRVTNAKTGKPAGTGRKGILWIRGPAVSPLAMVHRPAQEGSVPVGTLDDEGWYHSGDFATVDRTGKITLQGREDDLVGIDGKRVALGEVEGCIEMYPNVSRAQARVITDPLGGPMVVAKVVVKAKSKKKIDPEAIIDHCARNLAPYKVPRRVEIVAALS
ncbi:MAG: acyl--CoA ligase [Myxococcales bacterium]|nr:acyl--CoA ligase [Myxococcales bacterium]